MSGIGLKIEVLLVINLFGGQGNSTRRCWHMHFKSSLVPHPQSKLVNKFDKLKVSVLLAVHR